MALRLSLTIISFMFITMEMKWNDATALLEECERGLRKLVSQAADEGDYPAVQRIAGVAKAVSALAAEGRTLQPADAAAAPWHLQTPASSSPAARKSRPPADIYPQFFRRGDELVKVGWSKKDRKQYSHRAPRRAVDAVAAALRRIGGKGQLFTGDKLLPLKDATDGSPLADYQAYVALAWLKHLGIVKQHGRKSGYTLVPDKQVDSITTAAWAELKEWQG